MKNGQTINDPSLIKKNTDTPINAKPINRPARSMTLDSDANTCFTDLEFSFKHFPHLNLISFPCLYSKSLRSRIPLSLIGLSAWQWLQ